MLKGQCSFKLGSVVQSTFLIGLLLGLDGCASNDVSKFVTELAPKDQMFTFYGGNAAVHVPTTYREGANSITESKQTWYLKYFGSWEKDMPDPDGWSMFVKPGPQLQPGEVTKVVDGKPMICGNKTNDELHPMHDYYFVVSSNRMMIRNAKPTDFWCDKTYQDIWNYIDSAPGLTSGQTVLHTYCTVEFLDNFSRAGFTPKGPFECRFILSHYKKGTEDKADIQVTVYTETDSPFKNDDDIHLNIYMKEAGVKFL